MKVSVKKSILLFPVFCFVLSLGCATISAGHDAWAKLSAAQQEDFRNCQASLVANQCGSNSKTRADDANAEIFLGSAFGNSKQMGEAVCINGLISEYQQSYEKKRWLIRRGCPRDMVGEEEYSTRKKKSKKKKAPEPEPEPEDEDEDEDEDEE